MMPIDLRLKFSPFYTAHVIPYVYAGGGFLNYTHYDRPAGVAATWERTLVALVPAGPEADRLTRFLSLQGGYNQGLPTDPTLNAVADPDAVDDSHLTLLLGLRVSSGPSNPI
jgi:hypothetical protein